MHKRPKGRRPVSEDEALAILGLVMVVGILLGVVWVLFDVWVDVALGLALGVAGSLAWAARRRR